MSAEVIAVGSEIVNGQKLDTNSQWLSRRLGENGVVTRFQTSLGDDLSDNIAAFRAAAKRVKIIVVTGGLGPTQDDLTRQALADLASVLLVENTAAIEAIAAMFARRNRPMAERNRVQALFPVGSEMLPNRVGTAPGVWMTWGSAIFACLPGVPYEMKIMFDEQVVPRLRASGLAGRVVAHRVINLFGKGESDVESLALDLTARGRVPEVGITASDATISFRISAEGIDEAEALAAIEPTLALIRERFGPMVVGEGTDDVVHGLVSELNRVGATLAVAESCTGGLISSRLTALPGISSCFLGGVVSYANSSKSGLLGVPVELIESRGAVSAEVARSMAEGARTRFGSTIGLSVTGIAGPDGGSAEKPVGTVYLGLATDQGVKARRLDVGPEQPRGVIQSRSAKIAMNWARLHLLGKGDPPGIGVGGDIEAEPKG